MTKNIIPTINISSIVKNGYEYQKSFETINKIKKACIDIGFFQVTGHGISQKKIKYKPESMAVSSDKKGLIKNIGLFKNISDPKGTTLLKTLLTIPEYLYISFCISLGKVLVG